jgi:hypothetical protein
MDFALPALDSSQPSQPTHKPGLQYFSDALGFTLARLCLSSEYPALQKYNVCIASVNPNMSELLLNEIEGKKRKSKTRIEEGGRERKRDGVARWPVYSSIFVADEPLLVFRPYTHSPKSTRKFK